MAAFLSTTRSDSASRSLYGRSGSASRRAVSSSRLVKRSAAASRGRAKHVRTRRLSGRATRAFSRPPSETGHAPAR
eukprot:1134488-Prymnesium_polylepis.1